jgi:hypothetical protein
VFAMAYSREDVAPYRPLGLSVSVKARGKGVTCNRYLRIQQKGHRIEGGQSFSCEFFRVVMPDCREPVPISLEQLKLGPIDISLRWTGPSRPILTGDDTKFSLIIRNTNPATTVRGEAQLRGLLTSPYASQGANPTSPVNFEVGPGRTGEFSVPDHWMFVEGKFSWVLGGLIVNQRSINVEHPLASFTVFERSTFESQTRSSWSNLLISGTAAASSILAAVLGFVLLAK